MKTSVWLEFDQKINLLLFPVLVRLHPDSKFWESNLQPFRMLLCVQTSPTRHGAILELQKRQTRHKTMCSWSKGIECWQKYEPHYGSCRQFLWKNRALASVVNELFFHLILKLERSRDGVSCCSFTCSRGQLWMRRHERKFTTAKSHMLQSGCKSKKKVLRTGADEASTSLSSHSLSLMSM